MENKKEVVEDKVEKRLTYEQLNDVAIQLSQQLENAKKQLSAVNMANLFRRLDYLFKVVELNSSFDSEFVVNCTEEIKTLMTVPEEKEDSENNNK